MVVTNQSVLAQPSPLTLEEMDLTMYMHITLTLTRNIECVDVILNMVGFPNINARDKYGRTPLHYAAATAQYQCVLSLVANGASLTSLDQFNRTPLHYAAAADSDAK